ncbi:serine/threonine protein kinase [Ectobacillus antri]|jgi:hypothetical protein|uniref:Serine/threonine protein kinase n=1 Tax=Ectobacillus antri TaxID=2486280 RepID=A0ABT6H4L0_9BACI|nr:serine/threonine protein kinase [Ectobacillus antri]MDG4656799.1 serine/threonine protein kinase [Ectobacillus antri]MDG5754304.1 serine/threonine protein kinase [Ectobacillus antri]
MNSIYSFIEMIEHQLLPELILESEYVYDPVRITRIPSEWECVGTGNYAGVFTHVDYPDWVVKVYARDFACLEKEADVYKRLGDHPAYSQLLHKGDVYLILKRLYGITLYDAFHRGLPIPESVIIDVNEALSYAKERGLNPYDVHGKNVMMHNNRGYVVDISDFYKQGEDTKWRDLVRAYYRIYLPLFYKRRIKVPYTLLDIVRYSYRIYKKFKYLL